MTMTTTMIDDDVKDIENENSILGYLNFFCHSPSRL